MHGRHERRGLWAWLHLGRTVRIHGRRVLGAVAVIAAVATFSVVAAFGQARSGSLGIPGYQKRENPFINLPVPAAGQPASPRPSQFPGLGIGAGDLGVQPGQPGIVPAPAPAPTTPAPTTPAPTSPAPTTPVPTTPVPTTPVPTTPEPTTPVPTTPEPTTPEPTTPEPTTPEPTVQEPTAPAPSDTAPAPTEAAAA